MAYNLTFCRERAQFLWILQSIILRRLNDRGFDRRNRQKVPLKLEPSPPYTNAPKDSKSEPFKKAEFTENEKKKKNQEETVS